MSKKMSKTWIKKMSKTWIESTNDPARLEPTERVPLYIGLPQ